MAAIRTTHDLAAAVRGYRQDRGWSQQELATRAHVSRSWLGDVEAGKATAEIGRILQVFDALGVELATTSGTTRPPGPVDLDEHLNRYSR